MGVTLEHKYRWTATTKTLLCLIKFLYLVSCMNSKCHLTIVNETLHLYANIVY